MTCSVLILTKNEEANILPCIESARFSNDIVVFDSFSEDRTVEIARAAGARVFQNQFVNYGTQREAARIEVDYLNPWVLALDADERVEEELAQELIQVLGMAPREVAAFRLRRKDMFRGHWVRRASLYPTWHLRVYRPDRIKYPARSVHEYPDVDGEVRSLKGHLLHFNFSKGVRQWWERHLRYAAMEAEEILQEYRNDRAGLRTWRELLSLDPVRRRRGLKQISYRLPFRPELRYLYMMVMNGAVLDGPAGWEYCRMIAEYQRITDQIVEDLLRNDVAGGDLP